MPSKRNLKPILDASQNQLDLTFSASDSIDTKATAVLATNLVFIIFVLQAQLGSPWYFTVPFFLASVASGLLAVYTFWPRDYTGAVVDLDEHSSYLKMDEQTLVLHLLADTQLAIKDNSAENIKKSRSLVASILIGLTGVLFLVACIIKS